MFSLEVSETMTYCDQMPSEQEMRSAILKRDPNYDGRFLFGVVTTGIFCRPTCPSRAANPENLRFFEDAQSAISAGLRPCKRCAPTDGALSNDNLVSVARYIEKHADETLTLAQLAQLAGLSASRFQRVFKKTFGVSPKVYQDEFRLRQFKTALTHGSSVTEAIFDSGYGSTSRVYGDAARCLGMTPTAYKKGGENEEIAYAYRESQLGGLLMAATDKGVCFAQFGENSEQLLDALRREFPKATLIESNAQDSDELDEWMLAIDAHISTGKPCPELPLDLRGTAFQIKVWRFLMTLNPGDVVSYSELAHGIEQPKAVRAAASACGANRVAILVPCHRVLRSDGTMGGYRWGGERKQHLLDLESNRTTERV